MAYDGPYPHPVQTGGTGAVTLASGQLVVGAGTSAVTAIAYSTTPTASVIVQRDANVNVFANNCVDSLTSTAAAGATTTLTSASSPIQVMTGTVLNQTFQLPAATTLSLGWVFEFRNESTAGTQTVKDGGGATLLSIPQGGAGQVTCTSIGSAAGSWAKRILGPFNATWGSVDGLGILAPLSAGTLSQFRVDSSGNTVIPVTGVMIGNNTTAITASTVTQHYVLVGGSANAITSVTPSTAGLVLVSNGVSADPSFQTIGSAGGVLTWSVITADQTAAVYNGYICNKGSALVLTLPATGAIGDIIEVTGINTALGWKIAQNANQQIFFGTTSTTLGATGYLQSSNIRDSVKIVCVVSGASTVWNVISSIGNITVN